MKLSVRHHLDWNTFEPSGLLPRTYLLLGFIGWGVLALLLRESPSWAQDETLPEVLPVNQAALSNEDITRNEERLKRLEEQLLKTLDTSSKSSVEEGAHKPSVTSVKISDVKAPQKGTAKQSPREVPTDTPSHDGEGEDSLSGSLKEIEDHPVLQPINHRSRGKAKSTAPEHDSDLSHRLSIAESQVEILSRELNITRKRLTSAEKDQRQEHGADAPRTPASTHARANNRTDEPAYPEQPEDNEWTALTSASGAAGTKIDSREATNFVGVGRLNSSTLASIAVDGAPLRIGPGTRESALFVMPRHAQVRIEHRTGEWYRVTTDAGTRGWLWSGALVFDAGVPPSSTVRVGGFRTRNEPLTLRY